VTAGTWRAGRFEDRQAGDCDPLASCRLPSVLALEIKTAQWPSKDPLEIRQLIREISLANPLWGAPARGGRAAARQDGVEVRAHLRRLVPHIRTRWHKTRITFRGDGHYARPEAMTWCENNGIDYIFGLEGPWIFARAALATFAAQSITERARQNPKYPAGSHPNQQNLFSSIT
jgi:hypothetical protein